MHLLTPKRIHAALLICLFLTLSSCSMIRFAYHHLDWFILHEIDNYLNLDSNQKHKLRQSLQALLQQHQKNILPHYAATLDQWSIAIQNGLTQDKIKSGLENLSAQYIITTQMLINLIAPVMAELNSEQIQYMTRQIEETNQEKENKYKLDKPRKEHYAQRIKTDTERLEYWIKELTPHQETLMQTEIQQLPDTYSQWYQYNRQKQQALISLLKTHPAPDHIAQFLTNWWINSTDKSPQLAKQAEEEKQGFMTLLQKIDQSLEPWQRQHAIKQLHKYSTAFKTLSEQQP